MYPSESQIGISPRSLHLSVVGGTHVPLRASCHLEMANRRFDAILSDFQRKGRCVDDTIHYDKDLETHWWRAIDFLSITGSSGIVLNPDKFQFAQRDVDFAGFHISEKSNEPLPRYIDASRSFPTPT